MAYEAVIFDLGGVVLGSPLPAIAGYERDAGLAAGSIGAVIIDFDSEGAWARHERGEIGFAEFCTQLGAEMGGRGLEVDVPELMARIAPAIGPRPSMVRAVHNLRTAGMKTAALTNNWREADGSDPLAALRPLFDVVVESSRVGMRKPEPVIYRLVCDRLGISPDAAVFLDDLGPNLKPARQMGMATIKVVTPEQALADLEQVLGLTAGSLGA